MANKTVYPYGTGGSLPSSIGIIDDLKTGGADKALSADQGKVIGNTLDKYFKVLFFENSSSADWQTGNVQNGSIISTYANKYLIVSGFPSGVTEFYVKRTPPDSTYTLEVYGSTNGTSWTSLGGFNTSGGTKTYQIGSYTQMLFLLWDKPTTERAEQEDIEISYYVPSVLLDKDISNTLVGSVGKIAGIDIVRKMATDVWKQTLVPGTDEFYWEQGGVNGDTGASQSDTHAIRSNYISVKKTGYTYIYPNPISGENFFICLYDSSKSKETNLVSFGDLSASINNSLSTDYGYIRLCYYGNTNIAPSNEDAAKSKIVIGLSQNVAPADTEKTYENPVIRYDNPDPTVWDGEDGYFYLFATGNLASKTMWRSANLYKWQQTGDAPFDATEALKIATAFGASSVSQTFWAPHMCKINPTTWNLYIGKPNGGFAILTSHNPTRGFKYVKFIEKPLSGAGEFIDPEVAVDMDGKVWMFTGGSQSIFRREMTEDGLDWAEGSSFERCAGLTSSTARESTFEGPYLYRRYGYWYMFCSSGAYNSGNYKLRVIRSQTLGGTFVDKSGNSAVDGYAETVLQSNGTILTGPGHNAPIFADADNNTWILYHSHWSGFQSSSDRGVCLDRIKWSEYWPLVDDGVPSTVHAVPSYFR